MTTPINPPYPHRFSLDSDEPVALVTLDGVVVCSPAATTPMETLLQTSERLRRAMSDDDLAETVLRELTKP